MGCGESKQAVATENTLAMSKSKNLENNTPIEKPANDVETNVKENGNEIRDADKKESKGGSENSPSKETDGGGDVKEFGVDENVVVVEENMKKDNDDGDQEELLKGGEKEKQLLVSNESPKENDDHDHEVESIESIISEGISGKSDYYSPRAKGHEEKDAEAKLNKEKVTEEVLKVDEGKAVATPTDETKSSGEENISATAKNETANAASTN